MSLMGRIFKRDDGLVSASKIRMTDIMRWSRVPLAPLTTEELLELKVAFKSCDSNCPIAIIFKSLMDHIMWQEAHLKDVKQNYDK